ncbi:hypothetical protein M0R88_11130 [Halorussus gelatinilyticus]|uniref:DUF7312 domain-containing protein n=1 Tax=Halorussus gelatinilyticus TaxID=2937524 RepID=A0A8U0IDE2_9EURY|nr:hypothetical protein [Halorussus gelatinilyticus]UPV99079.1 hypothetical protein M0R88_11130 [Halorussus gelatinilyticus]
MSDWKYDTDEVGEDGYEPEEADDIPPIEPGSPTLENALFVVLGIAATLFVFARLFLSAGG